MHPHKSSTPPGLIWARNLLGRMLAAAQRDVGRVWLLTGLGEHLSAALAERRAAADTARQIGAEVRSAQSVITEAIADGVVDRREAKAIATALATPERTANALAETLT